MTLLRPGSRLNGLSHGGRSSFRGEEAVRLVGQDAMGAEVEVYYRLADTVPLGFMVVDHTRPGAPPVEVGTEGWGDGDGAAALASRAVFRQGTEVFRYRYVDRAWLEDADEALFRDPSRFDVAEYLSEGQG